MKVGYCVEGGNDKWLLHGLHDRWCPAVELVEGRFRGSFKRREILHACLELHTKGVEVIILLRDANDENWREVARGDRAACGPQHTHMTIVGVCDRNVECWYLADKQYVAMQTGRPVCEFEGSDPKLAFNRAMGITRLEDQRDKLTRFVFGAPLHNWLANRSFEDFYDQIRLKGNELSCSVENLRESHTKS